MRLETALKDDALETDAFNLANCDAHCRLIARATGDLVANNASSKANARDLLRNLIARETYGAFAELSAYDWLTRCNLRIATQVHMTPSDVLGVKGSTLDGRIDCGSVYFDVKAFGSNGRLAQRLKEKLAAEFPDDQVLVEESWDLSFGAFSKLLETASDIAAELRQKRFVRKGRLQIRLRAKEPVTVSMRGVDPYHLAKENALFPFSDAKQFTRNNPFILIFVVHPWFNALSIHNDFAGIDTIFTRSLARRAFMQFSTDSRRLGVTANAKQVPAAVTLADASRLLSAIFFINVWPKDADPSITYIMPSWLYVNPRATHRLPPGSLGIFRAQNPQGTSIDDFADDDY
jgi:hypothetical protein